LDSNIKKQFIILKKIIDNGEEFNPGCSLENFEPQKHRLRQAGKAHIVAMATNKICCIFSNTKNTKLITKNTKIL